MDSRTLALFAPSSFPHLVDPFDSMLALVDRVLEARRLAAEFAPMFITWSPEKVQRG